MHPKHNTFHNDYLENIHDTHHQGGSISAGDVAACRAYLQTKERGFSELVVEQPIFDEGIFRAMLDSFDKAGITSFVLADPTIDLMEHLHVLLAAGFRIVGPFSRGTDGTKLKGLVLTKM